MSYFTELYNHHKANKELLSDNLAIRTYRAIKWVQRAEESSDDEDVRFISYWISFNAAYAKDIKTGEAYSEKNNYHTFLAEVLALDNDNKISKLIFNEYSNAVRVLLSNKYVYQPFWEHYNGTYGYVDWEANFTNKNSQVLSDIMHGNTKSALGTIFARLYTLRNQIMHGGSTWGSSVNRSQLKDANKILSDIIPLIIRIMIDNPNHFDGGVNYPPVK